MNKLRALQQRKTRLVADSRAVLDLVESEGRDLTNAETIDLDAKKADIARLDAGINHEIELLEIERGAPACAIQMGVNRRMLDPKRGFKTLGEFCESVRAASTKRTEAIDSRLIFEAAAPTTFGSEGAGQDGGFVVPPQFSEDIFALALTDDALLPLTDNMPLEGNSMVFPKDETTPWGTDGVRAYWQAEATTATQTKPKFGTTMLRLHKLMALVPMSNEIAADSDAAVDYIAPLFARSIRWKTNEAILFGTGAGQPLGMFTGAGVTGSCAVIQAKDTGQSTLTLSATNLANMIARLVPGAFGEAVWLITPDALPLLFTMTLGNYPIYLPVLSPVGALQEQPPALRGSPYGTLFGRPILVSQHAAAFSSQGDVLLIAPKWYRTITKAREDIVTDESLHLYFDADAAAYRARFRVDGQPKIIAPIAQARGGRTLSPFVELGAR
jgi:HK97 family phage major capsid protein